MQNFKQFDGTITAEPQSQEEFYRQWRAARDAEAEKFGKEHATIFGKAFTAEDAELQLLGDQVLGWHLDEEQMKQRRLDFWTPLFPEADKKFERYRGIISKIQRGGEETFRKYNLLFASMAAIANITHTDGEIDKHIARGRTIHAEYARTKAYASELQSRAGVFVTSDPATDIGIRYEYNGSLANIGVKQLDFMARHREADDIWVKVAQGAYKTRGEITDALQKAGLKDTADAYRSFLTSPDDPKFLDRIMGTSFTYGDGALWRDALRIKGMDKTYERLQHSVRGGDTDAIRYTAREMDEALGEAPDEIEFIRSLARQREFGYQYRLPDGRWTRAKTKQEREAEKALGLAEENDPRHKENPLETELRNLQRQLETVKKSAMPPDQKQELVTAIKNRINSIRIQMLARQKNANQKGTRFDA
ncbi:hypothetical protein [Selenomonas sp. F0473]|uniref:hypothetical protein n=1 Tax=Selenomonas sp. F0473 TaxID=999423 RepID=UPI00029EBDB5|nr:hypothetical protein [Selenomonas sp. F0473]EKU71163.1 hypothetical protein HMPREF9161_01257 [Selenomonas sp. F0473]